MCERCGPFYDPVQHFDEEEQAYWEDQYYAKLQKEHDDEVERNYQQHLDELAAKERDAHQQ